MTQPRSPYINTNVPSFEQSLVYLQARESWDYYYSRPYPGWAFSALQWSLNRGPVPTALPLTQILIDEGAHFLWRNGTPTFSVAGDDTATEFLNSILQANQLSEHLFDWSVTAAHHGSIGLRFSVDLDDSRCPIRITRLSVPDQLRLWFDPHRQDKVELARIQYPYRDPQSGNWYYFREEWSDSEMVTYEPRFAGDAMISDVTQLLDYESSFGDSDDWVIDEVQPNPYGAIPIVLIKNRVINGSPLGVGDLWHLFRLQDRLAITMHGEDLYNQRLAIPTVAVLNGEIANDRPLLAGEVLTISSNNAGGEGD